MLLASVANAGHHNQADKTYNITVTNITKNVLFTPLLAVTHTKAVSLYEIGAAPSGELADMAEGGNIMSLVDELSMSDHVTSTADSGGLLFPGDSVTIEITGKKRDMLSLVAMLLPTNDTFVGLNGVRLPHRGSATYFAKAYDAGSETNDELCANIPGPQCGGDPFSPEDMGEGYVYPSPGIDGEADLSRASYSWAGAVAKVVITKM